MSNELSFVKNTIAVTNMNLVKGDYLSQIEKVAKLQPRAIIFREKSLDKYEYDELAQSVLKICNEYDVDMFIHSDFELCKKLNCKNIHIPAAIVDQISSCADWFDQISVSCHSPDDVKKAVSGGATLIVLGTIFETDCKPGLQGRGVAFVKEISDYCNQNGNVPVYAIGGINPDTINSVIEAGAKGGCMMSYMMEI